MIPHPHKADRLVLDPRLAVYNNPAERQLQELGMHRKIRGAVRSERTMYWMGTLFTYVAMWKGEGLDYMKKLSKYV